MFWLSVVGGASFSWGQPGVRPSAWDEARQLEQDEQLQAAFLKYLSVPGGESAAVTLVRPQAREFLTLLAAQGAAIPAARRRLIEAELLLATRDTAGALAAFRDVATKIATKDEQGWEQGLLPRDQYFVEPPNGEDRGWGGATVFSVGPGSHRDNWLLRRFLALEAWDDAGREFARVWQLHREATQPFVVRLPMKYDLQGQPTEFERRLVAPAGFNGAGLQFALDYAFFLQRRDDADRARAVLIEAALLIDMDRDPNHAVSKMGTLARPLRDNEEPGRAGVPILRSVEFAFRGGGIGVTRTSFLRLAFGTLKNAGHEAELLNALTKPIEAGNNRLRRVLAQVRLQQGDPDGARQLELDYIAAAKFDALTTAYRRALVFDASQKVREAAAEFENVLTLLDRDDTNPATWNLPDPLELEPEPGDGRRSSQAGLALVRSWPGPPDAKRDLRGGVLRNLERLYSALGDSEKALTVARRQFAEWPGGRFESLEELQRKHRAVEKSDQFLAWAKEQLATAKDHNTRASLQWLLGDWKGAAESLAKVEPPNYELARWKERYRAVGQDQLRALLKALVAANPQDATSQLELLDLDGVTDGPQLVERLELLLDADPNWAFPRGKGARRPQTLYRDSFELAYRLMRLYERARQFDKLHALGLRIAREEKPFGPIDTGQYQYRDGNGLPESATAALALAIQHGDTDEKLATLNVAVEKSRWSGALAQLERRRDESKSEPPAAFGWANLPAGVRLIASNENVLSLANDDRFVFAGHPWGVAVYNLTGQPVTRLALGEAARALVALDGHVWAGTPKGLFRIATRDWSVAHQWLHDDVPLDRRYSRSFPGVSDYWFDNAVYALAADGHELWIGLHRNIQRLNTRTLELRAFSFDELKIDHWAGFDRFVFDGRYVWADSPHAGVRRYDRKTDEWTAPEPVGQREPVRLVGVIDGRVFGDVWVNDQLRHRLCVIDRVTLGLKVIPLTAKQREQLINSPLRFFGRHGEQLVFGTEWPAYAWDETAGSLKPIRSVSDKLGERIRQRGKERHVAESLRGVLAIGDRIAEFSDTLGQPDAGEWRQLSLPGGVRVLGSRQNRTRYEYPSEDTHRTSASAQQEIHDDEGGLFFVKPDGNTVRVSSSARSDSIRSDLVTDLLLSPNGGWLCTSMGVARLDRELRVRDLFTRENGLCANRVTGVAELLGKTYFSTAWGDSGGGLAVFDPATSVFTSFSHEDGLPTDKLESVHVVGQQLRLTCGVNYLRHDAVGDQRYRQFGPAMFDPQTGRVTAVGEAKLLPQNEAEPSMLRDAAPQRLRFLGGTQARSMKGGDQTILCGTRGLVILSGEVAELSFDALGAKLVETATVQQLADADRRPVKVKAVEELAQALRDDNPFYRANAIASVAVLKPPYPAEYLPLIASQLNDGNMRLRATALYFVTKWPDHAQALPLLKARLEDSDRHIRVVATIDLLRRGHLPAEKHLLEAFEADYRLGNYPIGAKLSVGVQADRERLLRALAPLATPDVFRLLLQFPQRYSDEEKEYFPAFGAALRRHPDAVDVLLKAHDDEAHRHEQRDMARDLFRAAGKELLPRLHAALGSEDRVIRSNAARACGAIGDPSSLQPLLKAVDLESGLSRASIVWALGKLKSPEALPVLAKLYAEAKSDALRRNQSGYRASQQAVAVASQYLQIANLDKLSAEWDELKAATLASPVDPRRNEELLRPEHILYAVADIGPELSQEFYRTLAASKDSETRKEAAKQLAAGKGDDQTKSLALLNSLLKDSAVGVRTAAAVSLIQLNDISGREVLLEALSTSNSGDKYETIQQLTRLSEARQLDFAKQRLQAIAADRNLVIGLRQSADRLLKRTTP
jgi:HEAT repeat protein